MQFYALPDTLKGEIGKLENLIIQYERKEADSLELKAHRVPFGVYEQRDYGYMVRVRCAGGGITVDQLRRVAELSQQFGRETLHITTRQEVQIHDVTLSDVIPVMRGLYDTGLSSRGGGGNTVRNIMASPHSGIAGKEEFDVIPWSSALTTRLISEPDSWLLPRKYKIAFSNGTEEHVNARFTDLGFIAVTKDGKKGFTVYTAGGLGRKPAEGKLLHDFILPEESYIVAKAIKNLFLKHGNRRNKHAARLRFLWNTLGEREFIRLYEGERELLAREPANNLSPYPPDSAEPVINTEKEEPSGEEFKQWKKRYVQEQARPGLYSITLPVQLGDLPLDGAFALCDFLEKPGGDHLRLTMEQNILVINIQSATLALLFHTLRDHFPLMEKPKFLGSSVACTGSETCRLGICRPQDLLKAVQKKLELSDVDTDALSGLTFKISGCPNSCGQHMTADIGLYGRASRSGENLYPAYTVTAGVRNTDGALRLARPIGDIPARNIPDFMTEFCSLYTGIKAKYTSFADYIDDTGKTEVKALCEKFSNIPGIHEKKAFFLDWGTRELFSVKNSGGGECSAGLYDLIEFDINRAKAVRRTIRQTDSEEKQMEKLYAMTASAARALLITRGIEAQSEEQVYTACDEYFIQTGLVSEAYSKLMDAVRTGDNAWLKNHLELAEEFVTAIEGLYATMDNTLGFKGEQTAAESKERPESEGDRDGISKTYETHDFRGVPCPMNFVKTKLLLSAMDSGALLEVLLDDGEPIENVPFSVKYEGHTIVSTENRGGYWSLLIRKK